MKLEVSLPVTADFSAKYKAIGSSAGHDGNRSQSGGGGGGCSCRGKEYANSTPPSTSRPILIQAAEPG